MNDCRSDVSPVNHCDSDSDVILILNRTYVNTNCVAFSHGAMKSKIRDFQLDGLIDCLIN